MNAVAYISEYRRQAMVRWEKSIKIQIVHFIFLGTFILPCGRYDPRVPILFPRFDSILVYLKFNSCNHPTEMYATKFFLM
jgi:hypothetical protein